MFGEGGNGGGGGQKGGKLLARIGRAATFRAGGTGEKEEKGEEQHGEQGRRRRGWLKHFGLSKAPKNKSEAVAGGGGEGKRGGVGIGEDEEEGRWAGEGTQGRGVLGVQHQGSRLMQLGQKLESSDDSGRESGYTRFLNHQFIPRQNVPSVSISRNIQMIVE